MDAVINALPISMHCEWTVKAAEAGKHILCEKPLATSAKDCRRMIDAARSNNVVLVEGFTHRWNPHLRKARELVSDGAIGQVVTVNAVGCSHRTRPADYESIRYSAELEGGALREVGSYAVYAARFVLRAEPIRVHGVGFDSGGWGVYTTFCGVMEFGNGALANVTSSMEHSSFRFQLSIDGREGRIEIPSMFDDSGPVIIRGVEGRDEQTIATPAAQSVHRATRRVLRVRPHRQGARVPGGGRPAKLRRPRGAARVRELGPVGNAGSGSRRQPTSEARPMTAP